MGLGKAGFCELGGSGTALYRRQGWIIKWSGSGESILVPYLTFCHP